MTTGDADPAAFSKRLVQLFEGQRATVHAVAVSSTFESVVLKTMASLGGGSMRQLPSAQDVAPAARALLLEMTAPASRIMGIEFAGLRTARIYPSQLPNLPRGTQQIILGRYLPSAAAAGQRVIVTGVRGDQPFRIEAPIDATASADESNSFIPRLWARMHLDMLLQQGSSPVIKDEIIALSEEYHIITPYTSLLVLESDEDRERFKVKRRFQMPDGERFFAEGRSQADYELLQQQMLRAGDWRIELRRQVLQELAAMGRLPLGAGEGHPLVISQTGGYTYDRMEVDEGFLRGGLGLPSGPVYWGDSRLSERNVMFERMSFEDGSVPFDRDEYLAKARYSYDALPSLAAAEEDYLAADDFEVDKKLAFNMPATLSPMSPGKPGAFGLSEARTRSSRSKRGLGVGYEMLGTRVYGVGDYVVSDRQPTPWTTSLLPNLPPTPPEPAQPDLRDWSAEARALSDSLLRRRGSLAARTTTEDYPRSTKLRPALG